MADDVWSQTSFAYRVVGDDDWTALGTAETTSPRVFHTVTGLPDGALVEYRAVTVDAAGQKSAASTFASVGGAVDGVVDPGPDPGEDLFVTVPGSHNARDGLPGRLAAGVRGGPADQARRRHLLRHVHAAGRQLRVQGRGRRLVGRELRRGRRRAAAANVAYTVATAGP